MTEYTTLSPEQSFAFAQYKNGRNLFITGPGGTGKTRLIRDIYNDALSYSKRIQVCALTGTASILLQCSAKTIHSWSGLRLATESIDDILKECKYKLALFKRRGFQVNVNAWKSTQVLIIDEVSMMSLKIFKLLNLIGQLYRENTQPFGGMQIILCGDFFQLPPVSKSMEDPDTYCYCFEHDDWDNIFHYQIILKKNFRQKDNEFVTILNGIREGRITRKAMQVLNSCLNKPMPDGFIKPTKIFPTKNKVNIYNTLELNKLQTESVTFAISYNYNYKSQPRTYETRKLWATEEEKKNDLENIRRNLLCDDEVILKIGSQVMCLVNIDVVGLQICNGSQGIIVEFIASAIHPNVRIPVVKFHNGVQLSIELYAWESETIRNIAVVQIPLILSWAISIHKSQGLTLASGDIDVGDKIFECGQTYVALSRVESLEGLYLTSFDHTRIKVNSKVQQFYALLEQKQQQYGIPDVETTVITHKPIIHTQSLETCIVVKLDADPEPELEPEES